MNQPEIVTYIREITMSYLASIPAIGPLIGGILSARNNLESERMKKVFLELENYITTNNLQTKILPDLTQNEQFSDIVLSIIDKVKRTSSEDKLHRFKKILAKQMIETYESDFTESFLDIVYKINEEQIVILDYHKKIKLGELQLNESLMPRYRMDASHNTVISSRIPSSLGITEEKGLFYKQDLISKSLLFDDGIGRLDCQPFEVTVITDFGIEFLKFIEDFEGKVID